MSIPAGYCERQLTSLAFEEGNIQAVSERKIETSVHPLLSRIRQGKYKNGLGCNLRRVRYSMAPTEDREYLPLDDCQADELGNVPGRACDGKNAEFETNVNGRGGQCDIPGDTLHHGYDEFGREAYIKAFETDPICAMTLQHKGPEHIEALQHMLRDALPRVAQEQYEYALERQILKTAKYLIPAIKGGFTHGSGFWNAKPNSGLTWGMVSRAKALQKAEGWEGPFEIMLSAEALEALKLDYKRQYNMEIQSTIDSSETHKLPDGTRAEVWNGVRFVVLDMPVRGYLQPVGNGYEFVRVHHKISRPGTGGGVVWDVNQAYYDCLYHCNGVTYELYEVGYFIHPTAAERQAYAPSQIMDHRFENNIFNMSVRMLKDNDIECNKDRFKFAYRLLHAWGFQADYAERMGAFLYRVAPDCIGGFDPCCDSCEPDEAVITPQEACPTKHDECSEPAFEGPQSAKECPETTDTHATTESGSGEFVLLTPPQTTPGESLTVCVERRGGNDGAATVDFATADDTALDGTDYTAVASTLSWADGELGRKCLEVAIDPDSAGDVAFNATLSNATGAAIAADSDAGSIEIALPADCPDC